MSLKQIKSKYIIQKIFDHLLSVNELKILKYNKYFQKKICIDIKTYISFSSPFEEDFMEMAKKYEKKRKNEAYNKIKKMAKKMAKSIILRNILNILNNSINVYLIFNLIK